jgi:ATP-binding cassette subfamily B protein
LRALVGFVQRYLAEAVSHRFAYDLRNDLYDRIQRLPFSYHDHAQTGQLLSRVTEDVSSIQRFVGFGLIDLVNIAFLAVGSVILLWRSDARLTLLALLPIPPLLAYTVWFGWRIKPKFYTIDQALGHLSSTLQESLAGVQVVKAFAREEFEKERFTGVNRELYDARVDANRFFGTGFPLMALIISLSTAIILWFGGQRVIGGQMTLGQLVAFNSYVLLLAVPVQRLGWVVNLMGEASAGAQRMWEVLDTQPTIQSPPNAVDLPPLSGRVEFAHVSFRYAEGSGASVNDVSFVVEPNQVVALIGPTGSGKSSIINLIPRFYDVTAGRVLVDGFDVRNVNLKSLRGQIGIVLQDTLLFSATIRENIAYGRENVAEEDVMAAAQAAHAHEFILDLANDYDTVVGERGVTLSGGQKQRVAIARALLINPRLLILDDSMSSVDTQTEYAIQQALADLMQGRTTFVIAQRLSTVKRADQIFVLDQGRIVQRGKHDELLEQGGLYREIYDLQLRDQEQLRKELGWLTEPA